MTAYYHVTLARNLESITRTGVDPAFSKGKQQVSWFVDRSKLAWAILHVQKRYKVNMADIIVFSAQTLKRARNSGHRGIFSSPCNNRVQFFRTADQVVELIGEDRI